MAIVKLVEVLRRDLLQWNLWRRENPQELLLDLVRANLIGANLSGANLVGANLSGASLHWADLSAANLDGANLSGANLTTANLSGASLRRANLSGANLHRTDLFRADLFKADLREANLFAANLRGANLSGANLHRANLHEANLSKADLTRANLAEASLSGSIFGLTGLSRTQGLNACKHDGPSVIDFETLSASGELPATFLRGIGLPEEYPYPLLSSRPIEYSSCFISYSYADKFFAGRLYSTLQDRGVRCWLDEHRRYGDTYGQARGVRLWNRLVLCTSKASLASQWVDKEIDTALEKERQLSRRGRKAVVLMPLNLDEYLFEWRGGQAEAMKSRLVADFTGWSQNDAVFEEQLERVLEALRTTNDG